MRERDRFGSLFETVPDPIVLTNYTNGGTIIDVNPAFERTFGFDRADVVGESVVRQIVPESEDVVDIYDAVGLDDVVTNEVIRRTASGTREFLLRGFAVEADGEIHEYVIYTDITERKRRERDLRRYEMLVETVGDPMYVLDADGTIVMANEAMIRMHDSSRSALIGQPVTDITTEAEFQTGTQLLLDLLEDETRTWGTFEMRAHPAAGSEIVVENKLAPLTVGGEFVGSVGVLRDVTARAEREHRIRALHDATRRLMVAGDVHDVLSVTSDILTDSLDMPINGVHLYDEDQDGLVPVGVSEAARDLFGEPLVIGRGDGLAWEAFEAGDPVVYGDVTERENIVNPGTEIRSEAFFPLGEYGVVIVSSTRSNDFDEEAIQLTKILTANVEAALERAEREGELHDRRHELERQNDRLEGFAATVSHDLRNPLTLASGHLDAVRELLNGENDCRSGTNGQHHDGDEQYRDVDGHLEEISWALDRMENLIEDVLLLARSGQYLTETCSVDVADVAERAARTIDPDLPVTIEGALPTVEADENRLLVLFENLFRNAYEHAGTDVAVTVSATEHGFAIADDGPGIPDSERESIFENGYTTSEDGTGLGLAIVSEVVEAHGWSLAVEPSEMGGARFVVTVTPD